MCGIIGVLDSKGEPTLLLEPGLAALAHRGPDRSGVWSEHGVAFGHTRLRVIDLSDAAAQPMWTPDGRFGIVYNGELYNFRTLRAQLVDRGHEFRSVSDTEVVLHAWSEWGSDCLDRFDGMYAFGIWDRQRETLILARDRLGIKPIYWYCEPGKDFLFSSEVRALLATGRVPRRLNRADLREFLSQQTVFAPRTLVDGVSMLPAGSWLEVGVGRHGVGAPQVTEYWNLAERSLLRRTEAGRSREAWKDGIRERLANAVRSQLVSDVSLGAFLSGGMDSTAVVGLMATQLDSKVQTFTVGFEEHGYEDARFARLVAQRFGTDHQEIRLSEEHLQALIPAALAAQDHPSGDGINSFIVSAAVRDAGLIVALSGLGGDELFGGYPTYPRLRRVGKLGPLARRIPRWARRGTAAAVYSSSRGMRVGKLADLLASEMTLNDAYAVSRQVFSQRQIGNLLNMGGIPGSGELGGAPHIGSCTEHSKALGILAQIAIKELSHYTRDVLLRDTDQMSMASGLEVRVPFLDHNLVEYVVALPDSVRAPGGSPKPFLAEALAPVIPPEVASRAKSGFEIPLDSWMRGPLRPLCEEGLMRTAGHAAFNSAAVADMAARFRSGDPRVTWSRVWLLVAFGTWVHRHELS